MSYTSVPVERFGGLDVTSDPGELGWSGAVDLLNVDLDQRGRVRSRDGYAVLTSAAAAARYHSVASFYKTSGTKQLVAAYGGASGKIDLLDSSGTVVVSQAAANTTYASFARIYSASAEYMIVAVSSTGAGTPYTTDGTVWGVGAWGVVTPTGRHMAVTPWDSRLVNARYNGTALGDNPSTVRFANPDSPSTFETNNFVDVAPGDGEQITGMVSWRDLLFVFKETRFAVFYGTSINSSGQPIFNYRMVNGAGAPAYRAMVADPTSGVFFANSRGIWHTTGSSPTLISGGADPVFRGSGSSSFWNGGTLNQAQISLTALTAFDNRLYFSYPSGSNTYNDSLLVYDPSSSTWTYWNIPIAAGCVFRPGNSQELVFAYATGTNNLGRFNFTSGYTQDGGNGTSTGVAITSRYRSGFNTLPPSLRADGKRVIRQWGLRGSGTVTFGVAADDAVAIPTTQGGAQSSVSLTAARPNYRTSQIGNNASWQVSATSAWRLDSLQADLA